MAPRRRAPFARALLAVLFFLSGVTLWITLPPADSASSVVTPDVRDRALREGRVRVIAELRLPAGSHVPEGLLTAAAQTVQRRDIGAVGRQVLSRLAGRSHRVARLRRKSLEWAESRLHDQRADQADRPAGGIPASPRLRT